MVLMRPAWIFAAGLALRLALIAKFPLIFGGDPMVRMIHRDSIFISHQLPLLQLIVVGIAHVTHNYLATMFIMAIIGSAVGVAFYLLARDLLDENIAFWSALLIATNPLRSRILDRPVPGISDAGRDPPGLPFFLRGPASQRPPLCLALACFTRFEAWAAAPVLAFAYGRKHGYLKGLALYGWAPVLWILYQRGLAPAGSFVVESHITPARLMRWVYLGYITLKFTPVIVIALALAGAWLLYRDRDQAGLPQVWPLIAFLALVHRRPPVFRFHGDWPRSRAPHRLPRSPSVDRRRHRALPPSLFKPSPATEPPSPSPEFSSESGAPTASLPTKPLTLACN